MRLRPTRILTTALLLSVSATALAQGTWRRTDSGIIVTPAQGPEAAVRLQLYGDRIVRVTAAPTADLDLPQSYMVVAKPEPIAFQTSEANGRVTLATPGVAAGFTFPVDVLMKSAPASMAR